jgi:ubiquinone/menaquinone biosynthesis C-methylase UbiE
MGTLRRQRHARPTAPIRNGAMRNMGNTDKFDQIAGQYDSPQRLHIAKVSADAIREVAVDAGKKKAIDFGCGTGLVGLDLLDKFDSVLFLDSSPNMIEQVRRKLADGGIENADTLCFDLETNERAELRADYIFMAQVLLHIPDVELVLSRLYESLNPGGHTIIVDFNRNENITSDLVHPGFDQAALRELMTKIGYEAVRSKTIYEGSNLFMGRDASLFVLDARKPLS